MEFKEYDAYYGSELWFWDTVFIQAIAEKKTTSSSVAKAADLADRALSARRAIIEPTQGKGAYAAIAQAYGKASTKGLL